MFIEDLEPERSFEEFQIEQVNFDLFYIESPELLANLVNALLADAFTTMYSHPTPCLTYDCVTDMTLALYQKPELKIDPELLWFDDYAKLQAVIHDLPFFSIPRSMVYKYPRVTFASKNKALMIGTPQLDDMSDAHSPAEDSWVSVPPSSSIDVSGWRLIS